MTEPIGSSKLFFRVQCCRRGIGVNEADKIFDAFQDCIENGIYWETIKLWLAAISRALNSGETVDQFFNKVRAYIEAERRLKPSFFGGDLGAMA